MTQQPSEERIELVKNVAKELKAAATANDVKRILKNNFGVLGWKVMCRMFVLDQDVDTAMRLNKRRAREAQDEG